MGRVSRRQRGKLPSAIGKQWSNQGLEILVLAGVHNVADEAQQIAEDVSLVRSALLYADKVRLVSASAMMLFGMKQIMTLPHDQAALFLYSLLTEEQLSQFAGDDSERTAEAFKFILEYKSRPRKERRADIATFRQVRDQLATFTESAKAAAIEAKANIDRLSSGYGADELQLAIDEGVLEVDLDWPIDLGSGDPSPDRIIETLNSNNGNVMLDSQMRGLLGAMHREGMYELPGVFDSIIRRTRTGTRMIENLPSFSQAPMESILQTRKETKHEQQRYRSKVSELSKKLREPALSEAHESDIDDFWTEEIVPEVQHLQQVMNQSTASIEAARRTAKDAKRALPNAVGGTVGGLLGSSGFLSLGLTTSLSQAVGIAVTGAVGGSVLATRDLQKRYQENYEAVLDETEVASSNGLVYLIDVEDSL